MKVWIVVFLGFNRDRRMIVGVFDSQEKAISYVGPKYWTPACDCVIQEAEVK